MPAGKIDINDADFIRIVGLFGPDLGGYLDSVEDFRREDGIVCEVRLSLAMLEWIIGHLSSRQHKPYEARNSAEGGCMQAHGNLSGVSSFPEFFPCFCGTQ